MTTRDLAAATLQTVALYADTAGKATQRALQQQAERDAQLRHLRDQLSADLLGKHREAGEPSYRDVGRAIEISKATVCRVLHGVSDAAPRWRYVVGLLQYFGSPAEDIQRVHMLWVEIRDLEKPIPRKIES